MTASPAIEIRHCETLNEYEECVRVEHLVWGEDIAVPSAVFLVARHAGGQVLGAFSDGKMIGFTLAFAGMRRGKPFLYSHMAAVLDTFRDRGVGRQLKLFQRKDALGRGIDLIEWTFDPLEMKNAYFNLTRLGAVARQYLPNYYGVTGSPLHGGLPTDRLVAEWWIASERVRTMAGDGTVAGARNIVPDQGAPCGAEVRISLPVNLSQIKSSDRAAALGLQSETRSQFQKWLSRGYAAVGVESRGATSDYILAPTSSIAGLCLPEIKGDQ